MTTRYTLTVPLALNDGEPVTETELAAIERDLLQIAGGFTYSDGCGGWVNDEGHVCREPVRVYSVDVTEDSPSVTARFCSLAEFIATALDQEGVYVTRAPIYAHVVQRAQIPTQ